MLQGRQLAFEDRVLKEFQVRPPPPPGTKRQNIFHRPERAACGLRAFPGRTRL